MGDDNFTISRATLDDMGELCALGEASQIEAAFVERHLTHFQLARSAEGQLAGAIALEISGLHARLHSEMFTDFGLSDAIRNEFWKRIQGIARSRGLTRLWTQESSVFWKREGFAPPQSELSSLPENWRGLERQDQWLTIRLRDEEALKKAVEKEFLRLKEEDERVNGGGMKTAGLFKNLAVFISALVAIAGIAFCIFVLRNLPQIMRMIHR